jgi:hypothetical protein
MTEALHPTATHHLPAFITAPDETDVLMVVMSIFLLLAVLGFGLLFLRLHTLPERMAHKSHKLQFEIVAVLGLLALFTHIHLFWVAGLLLALIDIPDFSGPLKRIAGSTEKLAGLGPGAGDVALPDEPAVEVPHETVAVVEREPPAPAPPKAAAAVVEREAPVPATPKAAAGTRK